MAEEKKFEVIIVLVNSGFSEVAPLPPWKYNCV